MELPHRKRAWATCKICGSRVEIRNGPGFWQWCGEHGIDGSEHGLWDSLKRWFKKKYGRLQKAVAGV